MEQRALIVFAKLPRAGEVKTRLGKELGMESAAAVYRQLAEHTFAVAEDLQTTGVNVFLFYAPGAGQKEYEHWVQRRFEFRPQEGETLGERMVHAFEATFAEGAAATIIIGTDVPELEQATIHRAFACLDSHDLVLGPSSDGGYYLLGMKPPAKKIFDGIAWSTGEVLRRTIEKVEALRLSFVLLDELADIDTLEDYRAYMRRLSGYV